MQILPQVPDLGQAYEYTFLRAHMERWARLVIDPDAPPRLGDPPPPECCATKLVDGLNALTFFWPQPGQPQVYYARRLVPTQAAGWRGAELEFSDMPAAIRSTTGHIAVRRGLGKTTALLQGFWSAVRDYVYGDAAHVPYWLGGGNEFPQTPILANSPPILFFADLDAFSNEKRQDIAARIAEIVATPGCQHHRFVIAYRGWRKPSEDPVAQRLVGMTRNVFEVALFSPEEITQYWAAAGLASGAVTSLSEAIGKRFAQVQVPPIANNLPRQPNPLIGREREISEIKKLLRTTRLLTLVGAGGIGKTRLSLQVAEEVMEAYVDGVWFVELASLSASVEKRVPERVAERIARSLPIGKAEGLDPIPNLIENLKAKEILIVLDNCEHLVDECACVVEALLTDCPQLRILASSREILRVRGERVYQVPGLSVPDLRRAVSPENLVRYGATRLFRDRAQEADAVFHLTGGNAEAVTQICQRLDGIPLAIELAAARVKILTPEQIAARLDQRFQLLIGGARTALPRQQTLSAAIDWSYEMLSEQERTLFRRLAVFAGGCSLAGAERVCAGEGIEQGQVVDILSELIDKSLVNTADADREKRYSQLETIRQYGVEKLEKSGESERVRELCLALFSDLAEQADKNLRGDQVAIWLNRLEVEHDNLSANLDWCVKEPAHARVGLRMVVALWRFYRQRGHFREGQEHLEKILAKNPPDEDKSLRAKAFNAAGVLAREQGHFDEARGLFKQSLALREVLKDKSGIAGTLHNLGNVDLVQGNYDDARGFFERCLELDNESGDQRGKSITLNNLGLVHTQLKDLVTARAYHEQSLAIKRDLHDDAGIASSLSNLGEVARYGLQYDEASRLYRESLRLWLELKDLMGVRVCLIGLAAIDAAQGRPADAVRLLAAVTSLDEQPISLWPASDQDDYKRAVESARAQLDPAQFESAESEGRSISMEQITAAVLGGGD